MKEEIQELEERLKDIQFEIDYGSVADLGTNQAEKEEILKQLDKLRQ